MLKQTLSLALAALLFQLPLVAPVRAKTNLMEKSRKEQAQQPHAARVRAAIAKLGVGESARAEVRLRDKTKIAGHISQAYEDHFVIVSADTGQATAVAYPQVKGVKGNNLSTGAKVAIGLGIAAGVLLFLALLIDE